MDYRTLETQRRAHPAWRLLAADHAPFIVSFLHRSFIAPNLRTLPQQELASRLEDYLFELREAAGPAAYPKSAREYLDDWASDDRAWLRKYYPAGDDEPHYDITPATEKAIEWLASLRRAQFVGTESRLMIVFELLRQLAEGTEHDPAARVAELERRRAHLDAEIARVRAGRVDLMDATQVKDHFLQFAATARGLLSDFREVEQNFRELDRAVRERIAMWEGGKGELLESIFGERDAIADSDQGRSFRAFWDFLMSPTRQDELSSLLETVFSLAPVRELAPDGRLLRIHFDWMEAGEVAQRNVARLSEQLRRYLDDQAWHENRRIMQIIRSIEQHALAVRDQAPSAGAFMPLDEPHPDIDLPLDRPLHNPPFRRELLDRVIIEGDADVPADALYAHVFVDKAQLAEHIRRTLRGRSQVSVGELVDARPLEHGLAEIVVYLTLAAEDRMALIDDERTQTLAWVEGGRPRIATLPLVIFCQRTPAVAET